MNKRHSSNKAAAVVLTLAMMFSMASPLTALAVNPVVTDTVSDTDSDVQEPDEQETQTPKAEVPEAPKAEVPETPKEEAPQAPKAEVPEAPKEEVPEVQSVQQTPEQQSGGITTFGLPAARTAHGDITGFLTKNEAGENVSSITVTPADSETAEPFTGETVLNYGDKFNISLDWKFPDSPTIESGDTFTYQLPGNLDYANDANGVLTNSAGEEVGEFTIVNGLITITYTKHMGNNVHGTLNVHGVVDKAGLGDDNGGNKSFNFPGICAETVLVNRNTANDNLRVSKTMTPANQNDKYLQNVVIKVEAKGPQPNVNITDKMGDFLKYKDGTFAVYADANCTTPYTGYAAGSTWDDVTFPSLQDQTVYIKYQVDVDKKLSGYNQGNIDQNKNKVSATTDGKDNNDGDDNGEATATVDNTWSVDKNGNYDEASHKATWTITIDPGNDTKIDGTTIKELLGTDIGDPESVTLKTTTRGTAFSGTGTDIKGDWGKLVDGSYTLSGTNKKFQITIVTPLKDVPTSGQKNYTNNVEVTPYGDGEVKRGTGTIGVGEQFDALDKVCTTDSKSASTLEWKTTVKAPKDGLTDAIVSDTVGYGHTLVYGTNGSGITVTNRAGDGAAVPRYTIVNNNKDEANPADTNSFTIKFTEKIPANTVLDITYQTKVTATGDAWPGNTAYLKATEFGNEWKTETANHEYKVHLEKWGGNAVDGKFTWHAVLKNFNPGDITASTITVVDTLPGNNTFVEGSISVSELWGTTAYDGVTAVASKDADGKPIVTFTVGGTALDALRAGKNINIQYNTILTKPSLVTGWTEYTNTIKAVVDGIDSNPVTAKGYTDKPKVLAKTASYEAPLAKYTIDINSAGLDLVQGSDLITLKDTMGTGLQLKVNTVQVSADGGAHYTNIGEMGPGYSLTYNQDTHEMALIVPDSTPLKLKYSALVALDYGTAFTPENGGNKIELTGDDSYKNDSNVNLTGVVVKPSGTSDSDSKTVEIYKYEAGNISKALSGAHFKVEQINVNETVAPGTKEYTTNTANPTKAVPNGGDMISDATGLTDPVDGLTNDVIYRITETKAPDGFRIGAPTYFVFKGNTGVDWENSTIDGNKIVENTGVTYLCNLSNSSAPVTDVSIKKSWNDNNDDAGERPAYDGEVAKKMMSLYIGETPVPDAPAPTIVDNGHNTWTYTWSNLPAQDSTGAQITYTVKENTAEIPLYSASTTGAVTNGGSITNTYPKPPENEVSVSVTKVWVDEGNAGNHRPSLTGDDSKKMLTLLANGESSDKGTLAITDNGDNTWTYTWTELPEKDGDDLITYTVKEEGNCPDSYRSSTVEAVSSGETITNTLTTISIHITKEWNDNGVADKRPSLAAGKDDEARAMMTLLANGEPSNKGTLTIKDNGNNSWSYTWADLPTVDSNSGPITYSVKEGNPPTDYTASTDAAVSNGGTITNTVDKGQISVTKVDAANVGTKLANAVFGIFTTKEAANSAVNSNTAEATIATNAQGIGISVELPVGTYYVKELTAPEGYSLNPTVFTVVVVKDTTTPVKTGANAYVTDAQKAGQISVTKVDAGDTAKKLADAVFGVYESEPDANAGKDVVATIKTLDNGTGVSAKLPIGTYYVKETKAPTGYDLNTTVFPVVVTENATVAVQDGAKRYVANTKSTGKISITKVDADDTTTKLAGAKFGVYTEAGASLFAKDGDGHDVILTTDAGGSVLSPELPFGTYYVKEITAPDKYDLNPGTFMVKVTTGTTPVKVGGNEYITNTKTKGQISVTKVDADSPTTKLAGAVFGVFTDDKATIPAKVGDTNVTITTTATGNDLSAKLPIGIYYVKETKAPDGYVPNSTITSVEVKKDAITAVTNNSDNTFENVPTKVSVSKVAITGGAELAGAKLKVTDESGKLIEEWTSVANEKHEINGKLNPGQKYILVEVSAPEGYLASEPVPFTVNADGSVKSVEMVDEACFGIATITKHSVTTDGEKLKGCSYVLYRVVKSQMQYYSGLTANACATWSIERKDALLLTTGDDGVATATGLPMGDYFFLEVTPPAGHLIDETPIPVKVTEANATDPAVAVPVAQADPKEPTPTVTPTPAPSTPTPTPPPVEVVIPRTADNSLPLFYVAAMVVAALGFAGVCMLKRRRD